MANGGGSGDMVGAAASGQRVYVNGVTGPSPAIAVDLTGGSTTLDHVRIGQLAPAYGTDGIVCTGSTTLCTVMASKAIGGSGTTGIDVTAGASASIQTSIISGNGAGGVVAQNVTGTAVCGDSIKNNAAGGVINTTTSGVEVGDPSASPACAGDAIVDNAGGGVLNFGTTGGTVDCTITNNTSSTAYGVLYVNATGGTVTGCVISGYTAGGVGLQGSSTGQTISLNTFVGNLGGGIVATPGSQATATTVTNNTFSGTSAAGIELESVGGFTIAANTITTAGSGPGILLVGSDNNAISGNTVATTEVGVYVGGNDVTGFSTGNTVSSNNLSSNLLGGAVADGYGAPRPGTGPAPGTKGSRARCSSRTTAMPPFRRRR